MSTITTLEEVVHYIEDEKEAYEEINLNELKMKGPDIFKEKDGSEINFSRRATRQLYKLLGVGYKDFLKISKKELSSAKHYYNKLASHFEDCPVKVKVKASTLGKTVIGVMNPTKRTVSNVEFLAALKEQTEIFKEDFKAEINAEDVFISIYPSELRFTPCKLENGEPDVFKVGYRIQNSSINEFCIQFDGFIERLWCSNGCSTRMSGFGENSFITDNDLEKIQECLGPYNEKNYMIGELDSLKERIHLLSNQALSLRETEGGFNFIKGAYRTKNKSRETIKSKAEQFVPWTKLTENILLKDYQTSSKKKEIKLDYSAYDLFNALTRFGSHETEIDSDIRLESAVKAGKLLETSYDLMI